MAGARKRLLHGHDGIGAIECAFGIVLAKCSSTGAEVRLQAGIDHARCECPSL